MLWARETTPKAMEYGPKGLFLDWDKYKKYMPNIQQYSVKYPAYNNILTTKGERYAITGLDTAEYMGEGWFYNPGLLQKAGVSAPPDDFNQMLDIMKKVKAADPTADGYFSYWGTSYILGAFGQAMDAKRGITWDFVQKKWIHGETMDPNYKKLIEFLTKMYAAKVLNAELMTFGSVQNEREMELFEAGNYAFSFHYYGEQKGRWLDKGKPEVLKGMRPPKADDGKRYYNITVPLGGTAYWGYMASAKVKNPELLAAYVDNIMSYKSYELFEWGLEGQTFKRTADGGYEYLPEFLKDDVGGLRGGEKLQKQGVGSFNDPRYIHFNDYKIIWFYKYFITKGDTGREACAADTKAAMNGQLVPRWSWTRPLMSADANDEISKIMTPINTYISEQELKFISGQRPMSEWNDYIAQIGKMGDIQKVIGYYNSGRQYPMGDRTYPTLPPDLK
jgi:putative aldouronate transport system substrate-binding protein